LHPSINFNLAMTLGNNGQYEEAVSRLRESLEAEPDNGKTFFAMETLNLTYGHFDEAARWAMRGIREYDYGTSYLSMAKALMHLGQFDRAAQYLEMAESRTHGMEVFGARAEFFFTSQQFDELADLAETLDVTDKKAGRITWTGVANASSGLVTQGADELREGLAEADSMGMQPEQLMFLMSIQAYAESTSGDSEAAAATRARALAISTDAGHQGWVTPQLDAITALLLSMDGRESDAIAKLRIAIDRGWRDYWNANAHPAFRQMQDNPEFRALMDEVQNDLADMSLRVDKIESELPSRSRVAVVTGQ
jgi:tetratricopeptide (TPR) repeat protein